jgi:hypothetical protein
VEEQNIINALPEADSTPSHTVSIEAYERMCAALYAYRFGTISFLDLLTRFEEILGIEPPQSAMHHADGTKE